jgi:uncharacterized protein (DUF58 family)
LIPTPRTAALFALGLLPAALAALRPGFGIGALMLDALILIAATVDFFRAPTAADVDVTRKLESVISAHAPNRVLLSISCRSRAVRGALKDSPPFDADAKGYRVPFAVGPFSNAAASYFIVPRRRGELTFGDLTVRLLGPWGLAWRQSKVSGSRTVKAYPSLAAIERDAAILGRPQPESGLLAMKRAIGEGREFESLRAYVPGDDYRSVDWKATAKRGHPIARHYEPERNQTVMLLLDCGRHMVSAVGDRTKLDYAVDAALRLGRVSLERGDQVGLCAFGTEIQDYRGPRKGREALRGLVEGLYRVSPELLESDYAGAIELVASRNRKRALIVIFSDLLDEESSRILVARAARLRPRHLPLVIAVADSELMDAARRVPRTPEESYVRFAAERLWHERESTTARLREAGAFVVDVPARALSAAAVNQYLEIKARGLL